MTKKELEAKTVLELKALAKKLKITLKTKRKADIIKELVGVVPPAKEKTKSLTKKGTVSPAKKGAVSPAKKGTVSPTKENAKSPTKKETKSPAKKKAVAPAEESAKIKSETQVPKRKKISESTAPIKKIPVKREATPKPEEPSKYLPILPPEPAEEYGEDMVTAISVEPSKIFVFWEIKESTLKKIGGGPFLRIYDVTGIEDISNKFFEIDCKNRIGSRYIDLQKDKEYIVEVGLITKKGFIPVAQFQRISTFCGKPQPLKEPLIPEEYLDYMPPSEEGSIPG